LKRGESWESGERDGNGKNESDWVVCGEREKVAREWDDREGKGREWVV
jgi:hypothetical protein